MKITIINGNQRHGSTWNCRELFLRELSRHEDLKIKEFTLPKDLPLFCAGCFSCFSNGEQTCPHSESVSPIVAALEEADLVIFTSPVYAMDVSGPMKSLLDHLCFMWMSIVRSSESPYVPESRPDHNNDGGSGEFPCAEDFEKQHAILGSQPDFSRFILLSP